MSKGSHSPKHELLQSILLCLSLKHRNHRANNVIQHEAENEQGRCRSEPVRDKQNENQNECTSRHGRCRRRPPTGRQTQKHKEAQHESSPELTPNTTPRKRVTKHV